MTGSHNQAAYRYVIIKFLGKFASQSLLRRFAGLNLSARELVFVACITVFCAALFTQKYFPSLRITAATTL